MDRRVIAAFLSLAFAGCDGVECSNEVSQDTVSPDGARRIIVFSRNCGATTGFNTQLAVLSKGEALPDDGGNAFIADKGGAKFSWKQDGGILVVFDHGTRIFKRETNVRGIQIEYREDK
ncbi:MAG: hypothetical protein ABI162_01130 [Luteolibacter sp.]